MTDIEKARKLIQEAEAELAAELQARKGKLSADKTIIEGYKANCEAVAKFTEMFGQFEEAFNNYFNERTLAKALEECGVHVGGAAAMPEALDNLVRIETAIRHKDAILAVARCFSIENGETVKKQFEAKHADVLREYAVIK